MGNKSVTKRLRSDARFRQQVLSEAIKQLMAGDLPTVKSMLRDYINARISFDRLARILKYPSKSVRRMLSVRGKPTLETLFNLIKVLQWHERAQRRLESVLAAVLRRRYEAAARIATDTIRAYCKKCIVLSDVQRHE